jgi:hypothetical protein
MYVKNVSFNFINKRLGLLLFCGAKIYFVSLYSK